MSYRLSGKIVIITGGANGIGAGCARKFASEGALPVIADVDFPRAESVAAEVGGKAWRLDVSDGAGVEAAAEEIELAIGPVDVLVNSAGVLQQRFRPHEMPLEVVDRILTVNLRGVFLSCRAFGPRMARRHRGAICSIASIAGMRSLPQHIYGPTKAAVINMTECLAVEWGASGVRVNAVSPAYTLTPAFQELVDRGQRDLSLIQRNMALGRLVRVEDVANAVCFLCSDEAEAITGANVPVDCGWLAATSWNAHGGVPLPY